GARHHRPRRASGAGAAAHGPRPGLRPLVQRPRGAARDPAPRDRDAGDGRRVGRGGDAGRRAPPPGVRALHDLRRRRPGAGRLGRALRDRPHDGPGGSRDHDRRAARPGPRDGRHPPPRPLGLRRPRPGQRDARGDELERVRDPRLRARRLQGDRPAPRLPALRGPPLRRGADGRDPGRRPHL
ncbi:MAG: hypothetical protein AVDCRST_MAG67-1021, partial [uncultured Solirubrobacteraceae bacterium]